MSDRVKPATSMCPFCYQDMDNAERTISRIGRYCGWCDQAINPPRKNLEEDDS